ncbi:PDR/VanB family oxidoreductase [Azospirillum rugosum]|uniref:Vanillate O-demethylase ferredoxin subunit n=1 Tax=Azospirillum rugosum TaxID=416170 RepID=A0ABS4SJM3_9PROT|nr:PDR/VanB family oxidoreductase [Azospirillum rugosum]MBP2292751.1 vanillate O-demethylase ferredoxin subunit [Azospirillum rugosum]MDQ0527010.1 vanillate O-demethylase ferredoxin subunit [Azospirillum rugosum]
MSDDMIDVTILRREDHAAGIAVFELARPDGAPLPAFEAGAHIDVQVADGLVRQYSLCNAPGGTDRYRIGVLDDPNSRGGSRGIHRDFAVGSTVRISAPRNHFPLDPAAERSLLVGGGIGVTPMLAMAHALRASGKPFELHYCTRSRDRAGFLEELAQDFPEQLRLHFDDGAADQRFDPAACFAGLPAGVHLYVCGPTGFMDWVIGAAKAAGIDGGRIHFEYFNADIDTHGAAFEVVAKRSGVTVRVAEDQTILDALAKAGIKIPKSCEQGVCGTCLCDVIEGEPDHKDKFLSDEEREDNDQIVVCCSRAKSARLVLDV